MTSFAFNYKIFELLLSNIKFLNAFFIFLSIYYIVSLNTRHNIIVIQGRCKYTASIVFIKECFY